MQSYYKKPGEVQQGQVNQLLKIDRQSWRDRSSDTPLNNRLAHTHRQVYNPDPMLKRMLIILVLLLPTALPATGAACRMMLNHLSSAQNDDGTMSCCATSSAGHCPMASVHDSASSPNPVAPETMAATQSGSDAAADATSLTSCNCDLSDSSIPAGLLRERLTANENHAAAVVTPVAPDQLHSFHDTSVSRLNPGSGNTPLHLHHTSLRI